MSRSRNRGPLIWNIWNDSAEQPARRPDDVTAPHPRDRWSFAGQPPTRPEPPVPPARRRGPPGCVPAGIAFLLIGVAAALVVWPLAARPYLRSTARDGFREGIATEIAKTDRLPVDRAGELVVTEADLNAHLLANADAYSPVRDPQVAITDDGLRLTFSLYGTDNAYSGRPAVRDGRLVVLDGDLDGPAARVLTPEDAAALVEEQFAALLARAGLRPTAVDLRDRTLIISTVPAA